MAWHDMTFIAMQSTSCHGTSWHVATCHDMMWHVKVCQDMPWHDMSLYVMPSHDMRCSDIAWHDMSCHSMIWLDMTCNGTSFQICLSGGCLGNMFLGRFLKPQVQTKSNPNAYLIRPAKKPANENVHSKAKRSPTTNQSQFENKPKRWWPAKQCTC